MKKKMFCSGGDIGVKSLSAVFFLTILIVGSSAFALDTSTNLISDSENKAQSNALIVENVKNLNKKAGSEEKTADDSAAPRMEINPPVFDAGTVFSGDTVIHDFVVKNTGGSPLRILSAKTS
jgi:hypothetical protein